MIVMFAVLFLVDKRYKRENRFAFDYFIFNKKFYCTIFLYANKNFNLIYFLLIKIIIFFINKFFARINEKTIFINFNFQLYIMYINNGS